MACVASCATTVVNNEQQLQLQSTLITCGSGTPFRAQLGGAERGAAHAQQRSLSGEKRVRSSRCTHTCNISPWVKKSDAWRATERLVVVAAFDADGTAIGSIALCVLGSARADCGGCARDWRAAQLSGRELGVSGRRRDESKGGAITLAKVCTSCTQVVSTLAVSKTQSCSSLPLLSTSGSDEQDCV